MRSSFVWAVASAAAVLLAAPAGRADDVTVDLEAGDALSVRGPAHLALVNVPGSQRPLYLEGSRLLETYGLTPLRRANGLAITAMSYDGNLYLALVADFDLLPDLPRFAAALRAAVRELAGPRREANNGHLRVVEDG